MEMSVAYFDATLLHLQSKGVAVKEKLDRHEAAGVLVFERKTAHCSFCSDDVLILEALSYAAGQQVFYLEIVKCGRMKSFSFPLDSWKFHADRIEFKFRDDPETGLGLALTLDLL